MSIVVKWAARCTICGQERIVIKKVTVTEPVSEAVESLLVCVLCDVMLVDVKK